MAIQSRMPLTFYMPCHEVSFRFALLSEKYTAYTSRSRKVYGEGVSVCTRQWDVYLVESSLLSFLHSPYVFPPLLLLLFILLIRFCFCFSRGYWPHFSCILWSPNHFIELERFLIHFVINFMLLLPICVSKTIIITTVVLLSLLLFYGSCFVTFIIIKIFIVI